MSAKASAAAFATALLIAAPALAASRPVVVELFTSQGCSSCPPADALLTALSGRRDLLPLAFHVTYWNSLGWRDPFSSATATDRQAAYAARLGGGSYTPEIVVDGRQGMVGSERATVVGAIAAARGAAREAIPLHVDRHGGKVAITLGPGTGSGSIFLVGFDPRHETPVGRGENGGRTLTESNIVRSFRRVGTYDGAAATISAPAPAGSEIAVIVQNSNGAILAAGRP